MPTLDVISVNIWSILISLCNLLIIVFHYQKISLQARAQNACRKAGRSGQGLQRGR